jgi:hypothetical protein
MGTPAHREDPLYDPEEAARLGVDLLCTDAVPRLDATVGSSA